MITRQQGNSNLRQDLAQAVLKRGAHVLLNFDCIEGRKFALLHSLLSFGMLQPMTGRFPSEPWANSTRPIANQAGHVMGAPTLRRIDNQGTLQPQLLAQ